MSVSLEADAALQLEQKFPHRGSNSPRSITTGLCLVLAESPFSPAFSAALPVPFCPFSHKCAVFVLRRDCIPPRRCHCCPQCTTSSDLQIFQKHKQNHALPQVKKALHQHNVLFFELPFYLGLYFWQVKLVRSSWKGVQTDLGDRKLRKGRLDNQSWQNFGRVFSTLLFMTPWGVIKACANIGCHWILANNQNWKLGWITICAFKRKEKNIPIMSIYHCLSIQIFLKKSTINQSHSLG